MLMDCAWNAKDDNKGCMGGFQPIAFQWLFPDGKIASEAEYPYKGVTDFCRSNETSGVRFQNVSLPGSDIIFRLTPADEIQQKRMHNEFTKKMSLLTFETECVILRTSSPRQMEI